MGTSGFSTGWPEHAPGPKQHEVRFDQSASQYCSPCPAYYPSDKEFEDPIKFISSISKEAQRYGICKIVPPNGWRPPFCMDEFNFKFETKVQRLNYIEGCTRMKQLFMLKLNAFLGGRNLPTIEGKYIDMYKLHTLVRDKGGFETVNKNSLWRDIAKDILRNWPRRTSRHTAELADLYEAFLLPLVRGEDASVPKSETILENANEAVDAKMEDTSISNQSGDAAVTSNGTPVLESEGASRSPPKVLVGRRFFKYFVNSEEPDSPGTTMLGVVKSLDKEGLEAQVQYEDGFVETLSPVDLKVYLANGRTKEDAIRLYEESFDVCNKCFRADEPDKALVCDGCEDVYHIFCIVPALPCVPQGHWYCDDCAKDTANLAYGFANGGTYTLNEFSRKAPPIHDAASAHASIGRLASDKVKGKSMEKLFWQTASGKGGNGLKQQQEPVVVEYGSDVSAHEAGGGGFPHPKKCKQIAKRLRSAFKNPNSLISAHYPEISKLGRNELEEVIEQYSRSGWNLHNLPKLPGSLLQYVGTAVQGVMVPWIYVGMKFSCFCWHYEDHFFYSINYLHWGAPKQWYGVPAEGASAFEMACRKLAPDLFDKNPDLFSQLVTLFSVSELKKLEVPLFAARQDPGEFIVTFPKAYHAGFNLGLNCAEAVNFATSDWIPWGDRAVTRYSSFCKTPVFSHDALMWKVADAVVANPPRETVQTAQFILPSLRLSLARLRLFVAKAQSRDIKVIVEPAQGSVKHTLGKSTGASLDLSSRLTDPSAGKIEDMRDRLQNGGLTPPSRKRKRQENKDADARAATAGGGSRASLRPSRTLRSSFEALRGGRQSLRLRRGGRKAPSRSAGALPARTGRARYSYGLSDPHGDTHEWAVHWAGEKGAKLGRQCFQCKQYLFLAAFACEQCPGRAACDAHLDSLCACGASHYVLRQSFTLQDLETRIAAVEERATAAEKWKADLLKYLPAYKEELVSDDYVSPTHCSTAVRGDTSSDGEPDALLAEQIREKSSETLSNGTEVAETKRKEACPVSEAESFLRRGQNIPVPSAWTKGIEREIERTKEWMTDAHAILRAQQATRNTLTMRIELEDFKFLLDKGRDLAFTCPEVSQCETLYIQICAWKKDASECIDRLAQTMERQSLPSRDNVSATDAEEVGETNSFTGRLEESKEVEHLSPPESTPATRTESVKEGVKADPDKLSVAGRISERLYTAKKHCEKTEEEVKRLLDELQGPLAIVSLSEKEALGKAAQDLRARRQVIDYAANIHSHWIARQSTSDQSHQVDKRRSAAEAVELLERAGRSLAETHLESELLNAWIEDARAVTESEAAKLDSLSAIATFENELDHLHLLPEHINYLKNRANSARTWFLAAEEASRSNCSLAELEALVRTAQSLDLTRSTLAQALHASVSDARRWYTNLRHVFLGTKGTQKQQQHTSRQRQRRRPRAMNNDLSSETDESSKVTENAKDGRAKRGKMNKEKREGNGVETSLSWLSDAVSKAEAMARSATLYDLAEITRGTRWELWPHCVCLQPHIREETSMLQCDQCRTWFHPQCIGVRMEDYEEEDTMFCCRSCGPPGTEEPSHDMRNETALQCACRSTPEETAEGTVWICCDKCAQWYHASCVGVQSLLSGGAWDPNAPYFCISCCVLEDQPYAYTTGLGISRTKLNPKSATKQPKRAQVQDLVQDVQELKVQIPEAVTLSRLLALAQCFEERCCLALEETSHLLEPGAADEHNFNFRLSASIQVLRKLGAEGEMLDISMPQVHSIQCRVWHLRGLQLVASPQKPRAVAVERLLDAAKALKAKHMNKMELSMYNTLGSILDTARGWLEKWKVVVQSKPRFALLETVKKLVEFSQELQVDMSSEVDELEEKFQRLLRK